MASPFSLEGKTIFITGASSGIGRSAAIECSKAGATVIVTARNEQRLAETLSMLEGNGHSMVLCDLSKPEEVASMVAALPVLDGVVNNAGYTVMSTIPFIDEKVMKELFEVNTVAPIMILRTMVRKKKLRKGASVVFTGSVSGLGRTSPGNTMYAGSKGAVSAFVQGAALELAPKGIRVNAVCPGTVETSIFEGDVITAEQLEKGKELYPMKRYGKPEEIAWAMVYLLSDAAAWTTGTNMIIDGGYSIR
ncbi:MAG: SDR family oxidoreductase [Bacteroidales bacterium]|nr:SDR family oxidoreductase [Bacteroidales bacterium]